MKKLTFVTKRGFYLSPMTASADVLMKWAKPLPIDLQIEKNVFYS